jgi:alpha-L-fucosidase
MVVCTRENHYMTVHASFRRWLFIAGLAALVPVLVIPRSASAQATLAGQPVTNDEKTASVNEQTAAGNRPERVAWFANLGFGIFIHWSVDSQLGLVISHSLVGADDGYCRRFFEELPKTFDPTRFDPDQWARLCKLSGAKYVVFTAKHHSGFCMFDTATTKFGIMHTPYGKDVTRLLVDALRKQELAVGLYFSPDDFWWLHQHGIIIERKRKGVTPQENPELLKYDQAQIRELLTKYGPIDIFFIDGPAEGLREVCWQVQPEIVVTRGAMKTPEQYVPGVALKEPWEACMTMGTQWQYKPTNEVYKSGTEVIETLVETRAKGGNLLLNLGPKPDGEIPIEQDERIREVGLWNFINGECIDGVEPWIVTNEDNVWFVKRRGENTVYAIVTRPNWTWGSRREFTLQSVQAGPATQVSVLGQSSLALEYQPEADVSVRWHQDDQGLHVSAVRTQRIYNDRKWPNAVVLKVTDARAAVVPPIVVTKGVKPAGGGRMVLTGELADLGKAASVEVGFQYRRQHDSTQPLAKADPWHATPRTVQSAPGRFTVDVMNLTPDQSYDFRAVVKHPRITLYGDVKSAGNR